MKKLIALLCLLALCLPLLFGCSSSLAEESAEETQTRTEEAKETKEDKKEEGPIEYPDVFSVGYATIDITGSFPIEYFGGTADGYNDPLLLTCIAVHDGEKTALIMTADLKKMLDHAAERSLKIINDKFEIPAEAVILSCTHTHSAPDAGSEAGGNIQWLQQYYKKLPQVVEDALRDLTPVTAAFTGKANTQRSIAFVRRYLLEDGTYKMNPSRSDGPVEHESVADPEFRTIRFEREGAKDVLMVNFQTHYGGATSRFPHKFSADFVDPFREQAEEEFDCHFAYYSGAGANINFHSMLPGEQVFESYMDAIPEFMSTTEACLKAEEKAELGDIIAKRSIVKGKVRHTTEERVAQAKEIQAHNYDETPEGIELMAKYGFESYYDAAFTITRSNLGETKDVPLNTIAFGDLAFTGNPYEMFDTNGKQIRDGSPYKTTFICTLSGGAHGYVPSALGYSHGGYETHNCLYVAGEGETFANELIRLLNESKNEG